MSAEKMKCRECDLCSIEDETCKLTGRKITLDSLRNCKKGIKKTVLENAERHN
jgi:hypothetical protein